MRMTMLRSDEQLIESFRDDMAGALSRVADKILSKFTAITNPLVVILRADGTQEAWILWLDTIGYSLPKAAEGLRRFLVEKEATAYGICAETWMVARADPSEVAGKIADEPDKVEAVLVSGQDLAGKVFSFAYPIERDGRAYTGLGPDLLDGRESLLFDGLLDRRSPH